ncbi:MAG: leucyl/phenylalanyl-tRNA--protein transferase [Verrucomicrobiota bacterium]
MIESSAFPTPESASADGLVAISQSMSPELLIDAYRNGIFPWTANPVSWWSPDPRAVFMLQPLKLKENLQRALRKPFRITTNRSFRKVMETCAEVHSRNDQTWIEPTFIENYTKLHQSGFAHSIEAWDGNDLVGGLYGVQVGSLFCGESMFHLQPDASKAIMALLLSGLSENGFTLLDSQVPNEGTRFMGAVEIPRVEFLKHLRAGRDQVLDFPQIAKDDPEHP